VNILVTGSRRWPIESRHLVWRVLDETAGVLPVHLVHANGHLEGELAGVDRWAQEWAEDRSKRGLPTTWQLYTQRPIERRLETMVRDFKRRRQIGDKCLVFYINPDIDKGTFRCRELIKTYSMHANTFYYTKEVRRGNAKLVG
jgi:hypothetical protein